MFNSRKVRHKYVLAMIDNSERPIHPLKADFGQGQMNKEQNLECLNVSPSIAKPMLAAVYVATWQEEGDEPYQIRSDECKPKEKAGDSDWWFDEESLMFRRYWSYYHELYGNQYVHDEVYAVLLNGC